jgi:hypothetical protein
MPDLRRYWEEIRAIEQSLPQSLWIVSLEDALRGYVAGMIVEVAAAVAAKMLHAKTHRVATEEEVQAEQARQDVMKKSVAEEKLRKQGVAVVAVRDT